MAVGKIAAGAVLLVAFGILAVGLAGTQARPLKAPQEDSARAPVPIADHSEAVFNNVVPVDLFGDPLPVGAASRLGTAHFRHDGQLASLVFSPDAAILAGFAHGGIILWDARTGRELRRLKVGAGHWLAIDRLIEFSPDAKTLAAVFDGKRIVFWDVATGREERSLAVPGGADVLSKFADTRALRFSPDGNFFVIAQRKAAHIVDLSSNKWIQPLEGHIGGVAFGSDSKSFLIQIIDLDARASEVQCRDVHTGETLWKQALPCPFVYVQRAGQEFVHESVIAVSPDNKIVAVGGTDWIVLLDTVDGKLRTCIERKTGRVKNLAFTPDSRTLVSGNESDGNVHIWDAVTGKQRRELGSPNGTLEFMALAPDGKTIAAGTAFNAIRVFDLNMGKELFTERQGHDASVNSVAYSRDGQLLVTGGDNEQIWIWDPASSRPIRSLPGTSALQVALTPDAQRLAVLSPGRQSRRNGVGEKKRCVRLRDTTSGQEIFHLPPKEVRGRAMALSPDGKVLVSVDWKYSSGSAGDTDCNLDIWEGSSGHHLRGFPLRDFQPDVVAFHPSGATVAVAGRSGHAPIRIVNLERGEEVLTVGRGEWVRCMAFSPDGRSLVAGDFRQPVRVWEMATGEEIFSLDTDAQTIVNAVAVSPDGRIIAAGGDASWHESGQRSASIIQLWDLATGEKIHSFQGHESATYSLAFSPDGSRLASGLRNGTVLVWEAPHGRPLQQPIMSNLEPKQLETLWADLAGDNPRKAHDAVWALVATRDKAVAFLQQRLEPAAPVNIAQVRQLVANLDSSQYRLREAASAELQALRDADETKAILRRALVDKPSPEASRRIERLLLKPAILLPGDTLRAVRAVEILERIGTAEAKRLLKLLAEGARDSRLTQEAMASLQRLDGKPTNP
jgi:WD40 repeat protein